MTDGFRIFTSAGRGRSSRWIEVLVVIALFVFAINAVAQAPVVNGRMIADFAMVAYPDQYGTTGVMTFIVNHNGKLYQRDVDPNSAQTGAKMTTFDPGAGWNEVTP
jgi:hypothetical protein